MSEEEKKEDAEKRATTSVSGNAATKNNEEESDKSPEIKGLSGWHIAGIFLGCLLGSVLLWYIIQISYEPILQKIGNNTLSKLDPNNLGDSFGVVNAIIAALGFAGIFIAILLQQNQIKLQREDLRLQKIELRDNTRQLSLQRDEFEEQNKTLKIQRFENTFFQMLSLHHEITNSLTAKIINHTNGHAVEYKGRELFEAVLKREQFTDKYTYNKFGLISLLGHLGFTKYQDYYGLHLFDHYFRNLYWIFKFIDETSDEILSPENKQEYASIARASLSGYELIMLFFNCRYMLETYNDGQFRDLAKKYKLFNNLRDNLIDKKLYEECIKIYK